MNKLLNISFSKLKEQDEHMKPLPLNEALVTVGEGMPLLSRGNITAIEGHTGHGHSSMAQVIMSAALGSPFGELKAEKENLRVLYVDTQHGRDGWLQVCWRINRMRCGMPYSDVFDRLKGGYYSGSENGLCVSIGRIASEFHPDIIVLDTIEGVNGFSEYSNRDQFAKLRSLSFHERCAILVTTYDFQPSVKATHAEVSRIISLRLSNKTFEDARTVVNYDCSFGGCMYYRGAFTIKSERDKNGEKTPYAVLKI